MLSKDDPKGVHFLRPNTVSLHFPAKIDEREASRICQEPLIEAARKQIEADPNAESFIKQSEMLQGLLKRQERIVIELESLRSSRKLIEVKAEKTMPEDLIHCDSRIKELQSELNQIEKEIAAIQPTFEKFTKLVKEPIQANELNEFRSLRQMLNGKLAEVFEQMEKAIAPFLPELALYRSAIQFAEDHRRTLHQCALAEVNRYLPKMSSQTPTAKSA
jgi:hypothetical protein